MCLSIRDTDKGEITKTIAFIPIRGNSKSIPFKNIKEMNGKPLFYWSMKAAEDCPEIDKVYIGVDNFKVLSSVNQYQSQKAEPIQVAHMDDDCMQETPMLALAEKISFDRIVLMQATQPLTTPEDLTGGLKVHEDFDSVVSVCRQHRFIWETWGSINYSPTYDPIARPRRQNWDGLLIENGAFSITTKDALLKSKCRISGYIGLYEMHPDTYFDIDEPEDWGIMEMLLKRRGN